MKLPPYAIYPTVLGNRVSLRQIQDSDINDIVEISFYDSVQANSVQQATEMQTKINNDYLAGNSIHWGIVDNSTNKIVGTCGFYRGFNNEAGELGCVLLPHYRGQGFMTSAMQLAIHFGINTIELKRIWAITTKQNNNAIKLLNRLHFIKIKDLQDDEIELEYTPF